MTDRTAVSDRLAELLFGRARPLQLEPQQNLFTAGDPGESCALVVEGLLKVHVDSASGGERILALLGPRALVGELSMIDGAPRSASVTALKKAEVRLVTRATFDAILEQNPAVYRYLTQLLVRRLRQVDEALSAGSLLQLNGRAARALLGLADAFGKDVGGGRILIHLKINQSDIAAMAGFSREHLSRILQDWMRRGVLSRLGGYYCIEKPDLLLREQDTNLHTARHATNLRRIAP